MQLSYDPEPTRYDDISEAMSNHLPDAKERRAYALLQAAAVIFAEGMKAVDLSKELDTVVGVAEELLAEIERREEAK